MNSSPIKLILALLMLLLPASAATADDAEEDSIYTQQPPGMSRYDRRLHRYRKHWAALIPTEILGQYAGNMGAFSMGMGWDYGSRRQWETYLLFGFIPKCSSSRPKMTMTLKQNYVPWNIPLGHGFQFEPLSTGMYFNTVFGREFWSTEPTKYPRGYYKFATKIRANIFAGERFTRSLDKDNILGVKDVSLFYEVSTCDLYVVTKVKNSSISLFDILSLSVGFKLRLL
jgi:hypothetical protein